ncbi:hypothetical protein AMS68_008065 [Peltaster fructicola]|uniref:Xylanolytic transcriptional activator regulatory domain-containing protein n=1 Tax=Peltaster fructicola TaxID=286661 RepID=A0A6H0Y6Q7_9PEZI|nr:hypothetical protein AMS68_008065 [Peltaster fructicola]
MIPAKPRRRRFAERELLDKIRRYETIMRENNVDFEALHPGIDKPVRSRTTAPLSTEAIDLWQALGRVTLDSDDSDDADDHDTSTTADANIINQSYTQRFTSNGLDHMHDHLLFGPVLVDTLTNFHPEPCHIFRLWQIYLDNVNPLLKITHTPSLQPRIIEAMGKLDSLEPSFEFLLFSIYSIAITSLHEDQCQDLFHTAKDEILARFQTAGQQAMNRCRIWMAATDETLAAFFLFLISLRAQVDVRSLSCMLAVLLRMGHRNGLHIEATSSKYSILEAELRRRLWWNLVIYDNRVCELCNYASSMMTPAWDCAVPSNLSDFELRTEMKAMPDVGQRPTEASFIVLRSRLADFMRHSTPHLSFTNPTLSGIARARYEGGMDALEKEQETVFAACDVTDPLHHMTIWTLRGSLAKLRLLEHYAIYNTSAKPSDVERTAAMSYAIKMLECDTMMRRSSLTKSFLWYATNNFPALAYHHVLNVLCKKPGEELANAAWQAMDDNYGTFAAEMAVPGVKRGLAHYFVNTAKLIIEAWRIRQAHLRQQELHMTTVPQLVWDSQTVVSSSEPTPESILTNEALSPSVAVVDTAIDLDFDIEAGLADSDWKWTDQALPADDNATLGS